MTLRKNLSLLIVNALVMVGLSAPQTSAFTFESTESYAYDSQGASPEIPTYHREVRMYYSVRQKSSSRGESLLERARRDARIAERDRVYSASRAQNQSKQYYGSASSSPARNSESSIRFRNKPTQGARRGKTLIGFASWYGRKFHGRRTSNGEIYNMYAHTGAHRTLAFGTLVRVTNLRNGRQTVVRINDRGPFVAGRDIDLSYRAAWELGMLETGVERVRLELLSG